MIKDLTELVIIIDVNAEMYRYKKEITKGLNTLINSQRAGKGRLNLPPY